MTTNDLPDPAEDLHWGDFKGPIVNFLAEYASEDPDRLCVCETSPHRTFSYGVIDHAANVLAWHLLERGIERGDVVMLYSARCAELIVAYMGVLRAGATVSVLDPQYPADRQIVYLEVSRPRAIVTIKKATEIAGGFSEKVAGWISSNLNLKARVPELALQDDGKLYGGVFQGKDMFSSITSQTLPVIGPDDIPTLSFTSGSEGKPKGVRGRHFSLTHYFPWMAERFGLSANDRFTMLSGIAHDPIQRDIFTPIFLGASVWIPSFEDIDHQRLAAWMLEYETTVTVLTPAMGQIMIGGAANQFPALRNAFLVGDVLIKRDVRILQELAPNATVVNMFGTTETQRAVSHYAVPSRNSEPDHLDKLPDFIPAGKGMQGVQLLVVDKQDRSRICKKGEEGEIYVRAAGLAEGYLNEPKLNEQKFLDSWFVDAKLWFEKDRHHKHDEPWRQYYKGPRDRLYRSGDVGKYLDDGNVICTGRIDDQVKVRGFRVELNDIDAKLSYHPLIARSVTVLRKQEEQLVSYVEPSWSAWEGFLKSKGLSDQREDDTMVGRLVRFHLLRKDVRDYLKMKLAEHEVPSLIVPLLKIPLTPNGKPDRKAVPYPTKDELNASRISTGTQLTALEQKIARIWAEPLGIDADTISSEDSWTDLGGDSMKALKVLKLARQEFSPKIQQRDLYSHPTLGAFAYVCDPSSATNGVNGVNHAEEPGYAADAQRLASELPKVFKQSRDPPSTFLLTGATGFLGSFVLDGLLKKNTTKRVYCIVRGQTGQQRLRTTMTAYGLNFDAQRIQCLEGDLSKTNLGLSTSAWSTISDQIDCIVHNGARVDWLLNYQDLRSVNVSSTISALALATSGRPKRVVFVSTTAVLDTPQFAGQTIAEDDDLDRSRTDLDGGYGQTKWVSEYLMREAGRRGLSGSIVRPGYILGDSKNGYSITDDFLIRMLVGCIQIGSSPPIDNTINMVPVDYVAALTIAAATISQMKPGNSVDILQVSPRPGGLTWRSFLDASNVYGYEVQQAKSYDLWRDRVLGYIEQHSDWAAMPLLDLVTSDFPASTTPRYLDDTNARRVLKASGDAEVQSRVDAKLVGLYLSYLVKIGFTNVPSAISSSLLPEISINEEQMKALRQLGGRGKIGTGMQTRSIA